MSLEESKTIDGHIDKRNEALQSAEERLRNLVEEISTELFLANSHVFNSNGKGALNAQRQLFQLLKDREEEVVFKTRVYRY